MSDLFDLRSEGRKRSVAVLEDWLGFWFPSGVFAKQGGTIQVTEQMLDDLERRLIPECTMTAAAIAVLKKVKPREV